MPQATSPTIERPTSTRSAAAAVTRGAAPVSAPARRRRTWPRWTLLVVLTFLALECVLLALTLQGKWFVLLAPGAVCASKAWETWREET